MTNLKSPQMLSQAVWVALLSWIDGMYVNVLFQTSKAIGGDKFEFLPDLRLVVGSVVVVFSPISCESLAIILDMKVDRIGTSLPRHHSIFLVLDCQYAPASSHYLQGTTQSTDTRFYINPSVHH
jgi:hypothetical protein